MQPHPATWSRERNLLRDCMGHCLRHRIFEAYHLSIVSEVGPGDLQIQSVQPGDIDLTTEGQGAPEAPRRTRFTCRLWVVVAQRIANPSWAGVKRPFWTSTCPAVSQKQCNRIVVVLSTRLMFDAFPLTLWGRSKVVSGLLCCRKIRIPYTLRSN